MNIRLKLVLSAAALAAGCVLLAGCFERSVIRGRQPERFFRADSFRFR